MLERESLVNSVQNRLKEFNYSSLNQLNHPVLEQDEYNTLAVFSQEGDMICQDLLFSCCGRLIHSVVSEHIFDEVSHSWTYEDLMQSGFLGINYALDKYNIEEGNFTSYSVFYIQREICKQIHLLGNIIQIRDPHRNMLASKLPSLRNECELELGSEVSNNTLAEWINKKGYSKDVKKGKINGDDIFKMEEITNIMYLDSYLYYEESGSKSPLHLLEDLHCTLPLDSIIEEESIYQNQYLARRLIDTLSEKQKIVVELYYGFDNSAVCKFTGKITFETVAKVLTVRRGESWCKTRCQRLHTRALKRMKDMVSSITSEMEYSYTGA